MKKLDWVCLVIAVIFLIAGLVCYIINPNMFKIKPTDAITLIEDRVKEMTNESSILLKGEKVTQNILGTQTADYFSTIGENEIYADICVSKGNYVKIIPAPDVLNNQYYYYNNGTLMLYVSESNTINGKTKYYFYRDKFVDAKKYSEEKEYLNFENENTDEILNRSKIIYTKYMEAK